MPDQGQHNRLFSPAIERFVGSFLLKALGCMTQITHLTQECSASDIIARCFGGTPERLAGCEKRSLKIQPFCLKDCPEFKRPSSVKGSFRQRLLQLKCSANTASLNPTKTVLPTFRVGARRLPVGPSMAAIASSLRPFLRSNDATFLPFMATRVDAAAMMSGQSAALNFLLASTVSLMSIERASKNLDALTQVVQPFLR